MESKINGIIEWKETRLGVSDDIGLFSALAESDSLQTEPWYILAMVKSSIKSYDTDLFVSHLMKNKDKISKNDYVKICFVLSVLGYRQSAGEFAFELKDDSNIMNIIYGLMIEYMNEDVLESTGEYILKALTDKYISVDENRGGWALSGNVPDPDVTAMALQSLSYYSDNEEVSALIDKGLLYLSSIQKNTGGFVSWGNENPETTSQVIISLCCLGIDPVNDLRFIKDGKTLTDGMDLFLTESGGYAHYSGGDPNDTASYQALMAMTAQKLLKENKTIFDPEETSDDKTEPTEINTPTEPVEPAKKDGIPLKTIVVISSAAVLCLFFLLFAIKNRNNKKRIIIAAIVVAVLFTVICFLDLKSPEEFVNSGAPEPINEDSITVSFSIEGPESIVLLPETKYVLHEDDTVKSLLERISKYIGKSADFSGGYLRGYDGYYEFDYGSNSGWVFYVNGELPMSSMSEYKPKQNDNIVLKYISDFTE